MKNVITLAIVCFLFITLIHGEEKVKQESDLLKDFYLRETVEPVPGQMSTGFESITAQDAQTYLEFLASDLMAGRDTASDTYQIVSEFAASLFRLWKINPAGDFPRPRIKKFTSRLKEKSKKPERVRSYFQEVVMKEILDYDQSITLHSRRGAINRSRTFYPDVDYNKSYFHIYSGKTEEISTPVVFVGYGISEQSLGFDEYKGIDVKGKVALMFGGLPWEDREDSPLKKGKLKDKYYPSEEQFRKQNWISHQVKLLTEKGAAAVLMTGSSGPDYMKRMAQYKLGKKVILDGAKYLDIFHDDSRLLGEKIPVIYIPRDMIDFMFEYAGAGVTPEALKDKINKNRVPQSRELPGVFITIKQDSKTQLVNCRNVLGYIEGSDPELKKETVVIGAHLDHMGKSDNRILNGANDNASGSAALLEIAHAFALNPVKPKRSVLFALWTGEERGLIGSSYYVNVPYFPLDKTRAYLNMDMIGWVWESKEIMAKYADWENKSIPDGILDKIDLARFLALSLSDRTGNLYNALKESGRWVGMSLYLDNREDDITAADGWPFFRKHIPAVHIAAGMDEKYHRPEDDIEYIDFDLVERIARMVYAAAFNLADQ